MTGLTSSSHYKQYPVSAIISTNCQPIDILLVLEFIDEFEAFLKELGAGQLHRKNIAILALEPSLQAHLKHIGVPYLSTIGYLGKAGHEKCLFHSDKIIRTIRASINIQDNLGIRRSYNHALIYYLRLVVNDCLFLAEVLNQAATALNAGRIICPQGNLTLTNLPPIESDRFLGEIARQYCQAKGLDFEIIPALKTKKQVSLRNKIRKFLSTLSFPFLKSVYKYGFRKKRPILAPDPGYGLPDFLSSLQKNWSSCFQIYLNLKNFRNDIFKLFFNHDFWSFISIPTWCPASEKRKIRRVIEHNIKTLNAAFLKNKHDFEFHGIDLQPILKKYLENALWPYILDLYGQSKHLDNIFKSRKPAMAVSQGSVGLAGILGEICKKHEIPSLLISHGSHVPPKNQYEYIEWNEHGLGLMNTDYQYLALQTPWAAKYLKHIPTSSKTVITGPLVFARRLTNISKDSAKLRDQILLKTGAERIILHAGTPKRRLRRRFYVYETVDEYVENINDLIQAVEKINALYLMVRFRPTSDLTQRDLTTLLAKSNSYGIYSEGAFAKYLQAADLLVSYSSTTIEEALQNRIPVLQYDPHGKYCHVPCQQLIPGKIPRPEACYFVGAKDNLHWALRWITENHLNGNVLPQTAWNSHIFSDSEIETVEEHFGHLFQKSPTISAKNRC